MREPPAPNVGGFLFPKISAISYEVFEVLFYDLVL